MPVIGPRFPHAHLQRPQVVFAPLLPTQDQRTVKVIRFAADARWRSNIRSFPKQWYEPSETDVKTASGTPVRTGVVVYPERAIGPDPPTVVLAAPAVTTPSVNLASGILTNQRRAQQRRPASQLSPPAVTATTTLPPPLNLNSLPPDRLAHRYHRQPPVPSAGPIFPPTTLQVFAGPRATLVSVRTRLERQRHRLPASFLNQPATLEPESVQLAERQLRITRVTTRPRAKRVLLARPTSIRTPSVEQQQQTIRATLVRTRPRRTVSTLGPLIFYRQTSEITVALARTRPRSTRKILASPTALQEFFGPAEIEVAVRIPIEDRRRLPHSRLAPPTVVRVPEVEQLEQTVRVVLVRTRPRPTTRFLSRPTALQVFRATTVFLVRVRPRPTSKGLAAPTVVRVPSVELREDTITVQLVRTRPRPTARRLSPPTVIQGNPPVVTTLANVSDAIRDRRALNQRLPNQGQRQRVVRETGTTVTYQQRDPLVGPRPPQIIDPLPSQRVQTVAATLVAVRTRIEAQRRAGRPHLTLVVYRPPAKTVLTVALTALRTRIEQGRHAPRSVLGEPAVVGHAVFLGPATALVQARPRPTVRALGEPIVLATFTGPRVSLTRTRPRLTSKRLQVPTVVRVPAVEQAQDTVKVELVRTRPRPTALRLGAPLAVAQAPLVTQIAVALTRTRPRSKRAVLAPPGTLQTFAGARTLLVRRVTRSFRSTLESPRVITPPPRVAIVVIRVVLAALQDALRRDRRRARYHIAAPTALKIRQDYFSAGLPRIWWATGLPAVDAPVRGEDWILGRPILGWVTGEPSVDILAEGPDEDWTVELPL